MEGKSRVGAITKVGPLDDVIPSANELRAIRAIRKTSREFKFSRPKSAAWRQDLRTLLGDWHKVNYWRLLGSRAAFEETADRLGSGPDVLGPEWTGNLWGVEFDVPETVLELLATLRLDSDSRPVKLALLGSTNDWAYKGSHYSHDTPYTDDQVRLLILELHEKENDRFQRLRQKFDESDEPTQPRTRPRIPENVRVEVWRRDGGKCARCGSRQDLEFDHIVPVSRGGSNTTRNIELLCEKCNRGKGSDIG